MQKLSSFRGKTKNWPKKSLTWFFHAALQLWSEESIGRMSQIRLKTQQLIAYRHWTNLFSGKVKIDSHPCFVFNSSTH